MEVKQQKKEILLESGTNEVEMLDFLVGGQSFAVNVAKVQRILQYREEDITRLPEEEGVPHLRYTIEGRTVRLVELDKTLRLKTDEDNDRRIVILLGFNNIEVAILIDAVNSIHRLSWNDFKNIDGFSATVTDTNLIVGTFNTQGSDVLVLDFERIMTSIFPETSMETVIEAVDDDVARRGTFKIFHVDDSSTIRKIFHKTLSDSGYSDIKSFTNGQECYEFLKELRERIDKQETTLDQELNAIVIDIEMPQMDGLTLCKKIREEFQFKELAIIMFSSLIDQQMIDKCKSVGATVPIAKPDIVRLVNIVDSYLLD